MTLEELRTAAENVPFTGSMELAAFEAFRDVRKVLLGIIGHLEELEGRQGDTHHGRLLGSDLECERCHGTGADPDSAFLACTKCGGTGGA
jgi:hypothetical protein